ncbi:MAG: SH3 domain-containing protein [Clostridia bacterium]|nr:SH3 domain-containing protein [Clostridia bacterium]
MTRGWRKAVSLALAAILLIVLLPELPGGDAFAAASYGKTTAADVAVRKEASTSSDIWFRVDKGTVAQILTVQTIGKTVWYKVQLEKPGSGTKNVYVGFIRGEYFAELNSTETAAWVQNPVNTVTAGGQAAASSGRGVGTITNSGVNFRSSPSLKGSVIMKLDRGATVELISIPAANSPDPWYEIWYAGNTGFVQGPYVKVVSVGSANVSNSTINADGSVTVSTNPTTDTAQTQPTTVQQPTVIAPAASTNYVKLLLNQTNLYSLPNGAVVTQWTGVGSTLPLAGAATMYGGYAWYPVQYGSIVYYVRGDSVQITTQPAAQAAATATPAPTQGSSVVPSATNAPGTLGYVVTTRSDVNLRLNPAGEVIQQVPRGTIVPFLSTPVSDSGYTWYYVRVGSVHGYLRGDCVQPCDASGAVLPGAVTPVPAATATVNSYGYVRTIANKVNLRNKPAGESLEQIAIRTVLPLRGNPVQSGRYTWYPVVAASGRTGYLRSDCVVVTDASGAEIPGSSTAGTTVTPAPEGSVVYGYVRVTRSNVNLRATAAGETISQVARDTVWPLTGSPTTVSGYTWYPVRANGRNGFLRGDCVAMLTDEQVLAYLGGQKIPVITAAPTATPDAATASEYVVTIVDKVNLRKAATKDSALEDRVPLGTVLHYLSTTTAGGEIWYNVVHDGKKLWVMGSYVRIMGQQETSGGQQSGGATVTTQPVPTGEGFVKTIKSGVNVRKKPGGDSMGTIARGIVLTYSEAQKGDKYVWYHVRTNLGQGWVRADCVEECLADGSALGSAPATGTTGNPNGSTVSSTVVEASYSILKLGSSGTPVTRLVNALIAQGYYTGASTSKYTEDVQAAVSAFQRAKGLWVDGIAGSATQHALFGTVPVGTAADSSSMSMVLYPAEKIDWFTGGIQELWPRGANCKVYDVRTGIVWWAHRWAGSNHADIEPLTAADTARLCQIYGVSKASDIVKKDLWQRRPCLVTINGHTYACSLYGVPHNYGAGDISTNNMNGQICMHFTNSKTHTSKKVDSYHKAAIQYAWENAPNGHK